MAPTFVTTFSDGIVIRLTTYCKNGRFDLERGVRLARAAYVVRRKAKARKAERNRILMNGPPEPPAIKVASFVDRDGNGADTVLKTYARDELNAVK